MRDELASRFARLAQPAETPTQVVSRLLASLASASPSGAQDEGAMLLLRRTELDEAVLDKLGKIQEHALRVRDLIQRPERVDG